jgi:hypothetical protein
MIKHLLALSTEGNNYSILRQNVPSNIDDTFKANGKCNLSDIFNGI